ncbi:MAG: hypothetical protein N3G20_02560, partial [Verrucomicrobiae bacterium]|nr:hypothetical protein [Verrucomicrobiae bacterium]
MKPSKIQTENEENNIANAAPGGLADLERWLELHESLLRVALEHSPPEKTRRFLTGMLERFRTAGLEAPNPVSTPYLNT